MDDILKRMLEVESEARKITDEAEVKSREIRTQARRQANDESEKAQEALAAEVDSTVKAIIQDAEARRDDILKRTDEELSKKASEWRAKLSGSLPEIVQALAFAD